MLNALKKEESMQYVSSPWKRNITDPGQWLASINVTVNSSPVLGTRMIWLSPIFRHCSRCALTWNQIFICSCLFPIISMYINHQILLWLHNWSKKYSLKWGTQNISNILKKHSHTTRSPTVLWGAQQNTYGTIQKSILIFHPMYIFVWWAIYRSMLGTELPVWTVQ